MEERRVADMLAMQEDVDRKFCITNAVSIVSIILALYRALR
jgi:hypothetical protein